MIKSMVLSGGCSHLGEGLEHNLNKGTESGARSAWWCAGVGE